MSGMRGEVEVVLDGTTYRLVMDFNALAEFEEIEGVNAFEFFEKFENANFKPSFGTLRRLVHVTLRRNHPDASLETAGDIFAADRGALERLIRATFPDAAKAGTSGNAKGGRGK